MVAIKSLGPNGDKVSFSFDELKMDDGSEDEETGPVLDPAKSLASFQTTVYPISRTSCISCHTSQSPTHAHNNPETAHDIVLSQNLVNFTTPASSRLVQKVRGGHNCGDTAACTNIADNFQAAITEWKTQREAP